MDVCSWNWELASKFIPLITGFVPVGITWFLYYKWHKQKSKEVISNITKEIFEDIEILRLSLINVEDIAFKYIRTIHELNERDKQKPILEDSFKEFNRSVNKIISKLRIVEGYRNNGDLSVVIDEISKSRNDINMYINLTDSKYFKNGYITTQEENSYISNIGTNISRIHSTIDNKDFIKKLRDLILYK